MFPAYKDGPDGPLSGSQTRSSLPTTGRCEPRRLQTSCGEQSGEPAAPTPRAAGFLTSGLGFWPGETRLRTISPPSEDAYRALDRSRARPRRGRRPAPACHSSPRWHAARPARRYHEGVRERQPRGRRAGTEHRRRACRPDAARRVRGALRRRLRRPDLRLRRRAHGGRVSRALPRRGRRVVARDASRPRARAVGRRERGLRGDTGRRLRHAELRRRQSPSRGRRRSEERRVRPAPGRAAGDRGDLGRDPRRASGLLERGSRGDADARLGGGGRARTAARRHRPRGGPEAKRGAARATECPASGGARALERARSASRPAAARRPARTAPRRGLRRLLPPRPRARPSSRCSSRSG